MVPGRCHALISMVLAKHSALGNHSGEKVKVSKAEWWLRSPGSLIRKMSRQYLNENMMLFFLKATLQRVKSGYEQNQLLC